MGKEITVKHNGQEHRFIVKDRPYNALDDLWVENRKHVYLQLVGANVRDDTLIKKARYLATFELVVEKGLDLAATVDEAGHEIDPLTRARMKAQTVGQTPPPVVNDVVEEYFAQFEQEDDEAKKS